MCVRTTGRCLAMAFLLGLAVANPVRAQGRNGRLRTNTPIVTLPTIGTAEIDAGVIEANKSALLLVHPSVKGPWTLYIRTDEPDLGQGKPIADLQWRVSGSGGWTSLTNSNQIVLTREHPGVVRVDFRVLLSWTDRSGTYQSDVVFELALS